MFSGNSVISRIRLTPINGLERREIVDCRCGSCCQEGVRTLIVQFGEQVALKKVLAQSISESWRTPSTGAG